MSPDPIGLLAPLPLHPILAGPTFYCFRRANEEWMSNHSCRLLMLNRKITHQQSVLVWLGFFVELANGPCKT